MSGINVLLIVGSRESSVSGTLAEPGAPVGIQEVDAGVNALPDGSRKDVNRVITQPVLPPGIAATETSILLATRKF